jgi:hypothetical protein
MGVVVLPSTFFKLSELGNLNPVELLGEGCAEPEKGGTLTGSWILFFSDPKGGLESDVEGAMDGPSLGAWFPNELGEEKVKFPPGCEKGDGLLFRLN